MSRFWRNLLSICIGLFFAGFGANLVFIFWPLLFPESLQGSSWGEAAAPLAVLGSASLFGVAGFLLARKLTKRFVRDNGDTTVLFR